MVLALLARQTACYRSRLPTSDSDPAEGGLVVVKVVAEMETFSRIEGDVLIELESIDIARATQDDFDNRVAKIVCVADGRVVARLCTDAIGLLFIGQHATDMSQRLARYMSPEAYRDYERALIACLGGVPDEEMCATGRGAKAD